MTHVDDLYEPGDDREPEPCEWYPAPEPLDLAEVEDAYKVVFPAVADLGRSGERLVAAIPQVLDELREVRQRIAEFEAMEKREEWAVTLGKVPPNPTDPIQDGDFAEAAMDLARKHKGQAWRRRLTVHPWEPIDSEAPF